MWFSSHFSVGSPCLTLDILTDTNMAVLFSSDRQIDKYADRHLKEKDRRSDRLNEKDRNTSDRKMHKNENRQTHKRGSWQTEKHTDEWTSREIGRSKAETPETPDKRLIDVFIISEFSDIEQRRHRKTERCIHRHSGRQQKHFETRNNRVIQH